MSPKEKLGSTFFFGGGGECATILIVRHYPLNLVQCINIEKENTLKSKTYLHYTNND